MYNNAVYYLVVLLNINLVPNSEGKKVVEALIQIILYNVYCVSKTFHTLILPVERNHVCKRAL